MTTQSVHCLLPKHKDLSSSPSSYIKRQAWPYTFVVPASGGAVGPCNSVAGLASLVKLGSFRF